jgi:hypothetical protein
VKIVDTMLDGLSVANARVYNVAQMCIKSNRGQMVIVAVFSFAIGGFVIKMAMLNNWQTLLAFVLGGALGAGATLMGIYFGHVK